MMRTPTYMLAEFALADDINAKIGIKKIENRNKTAVVTVINPVLT
jgi:hypothetical protein